MNAHRGPNCDNSGPTARSKSKLFDLRPGIKLP